MTSRSKSTAGKAAVIRASRHGLSCRSCRLHSCKVTERDGEGLAAGYGARFALVSAKLGGCDVKEVRPSAEGNRSHG
jgi:hypothetical protein